MTTVLLSGPFGRGNPGADALLEAFVVGLAGHEVLATATGPVSVAGCSGISPDVGGLTGALRRADAVVVGGGCAFSTAHPSAGRRPLAPLVRTRTLQAGAAARGLSVAFAGVGVGHLASRRAVRLTRSICERADLLVLRDEESAALLTDAGVPGPHRVGADPAWSLPLAAGGGPPSGRDGVVVALSHLADADRDRLAHQVTTMVDALATAGLRVLLQPWHDEADVHLAHRVRGGAASPAAVEVVARPRTLADAAAAFADATAIVALRHHALVAAAVAGCPVLAVAHEPKLAGLARRLDQPAVPVHASPAVLAEAASRLPDGNPPSGAAIERERRAALRTMDLLRLVVSGGAEDLAGDHGRLELTGGRPW